MSYGPNIFYFNILSQSMLLSRGATDELWARPLLSVFQVYIISTKM